MAGASRDSVFRLEQIARLPRHLQQYIVEQGYERYTPIDQAVWRYIMRQASAFHAVHAHEAYVDGLRQTGISVERIPRIEEMNGILGRIGWGAAPVDGFIPPAAFMEFQAHRVLVIAADIRQLQHIEYTPAPDIVHEAAGHAPIIADPAYAEYLQRFGECGARALSSRQDQVLYEAIRHLSIVKEQVGAEQAIIAAAERAVADAQAGLGEPSEMALLSRLHWWTVEYGLVGSVEHPRLYGAGLLSSIGEAAHCLTDAVTKLPYSVEAADYPFDITTMQPQLFVTPDFGHLTEVLEQFADGMSFRRGGLFGLQRALASGDVATFVYSSGLQVSGAVVEVVADAGGAPAYVRTSGPTALACNNGELAGHGKTHHRDGFGAPAGRIRGMNVPLERADAATLGRFSLEPERVAAIDFESGVHLVGRVERLVREGGRLLLVTFSDCHVTLGDRLLFDPAWGLYDMAVGGQIVSVFHGAADKDAYEQVSLVPRERTAQGEAAASPGTDLYQAVRDVRERRPGVEHLRAVFATATTADPDGWLLPLEILEVLQSQRAEPALQREVRAWLETSALGSTDRGRLIRKGLALL